MPKVGMRIIKSAASVFICYIIYLLPGFNQDPFYAIIAAILCMQPDLHRGSRIGLDRCIGTILGGIIGSLVVFFEHKLFGGVAGYMFEAVSSTLIIILLIYITVAFNIKGATAITCIVFLSITLFHSSDINPFIFGLTRIFDTLIGVFVSLFVNYIHFPRKKNKKQLLVVDIESVLEPGKKEVGNFVKIKLNNYLKDGAKIAIMTPRTIAEAWPSLMEIDFKLPLIAMNGAVLYDFNEYKYLNIEYIDKETAEFIEEALEEEKTSSFCFTVVNDLMQIYYSSFNSDAEEKYYREAIKTPLKSFVSTKRPPEHMPIRYMIIDTFNNVHKLYDKLIKAGLQTRISTRIFESTSHKGYYQMEIQSAQVDKLKFLNKLKKDIGCDKITIFTNHSYDLPILGFTNNPYSDIDRKDLLNNMNLVVIDNHPEKILKAMGKKLYSIK